MKFDFATILKIVEGAGDAVPAFKALFDQVVATFSEDDQDKLKAAYAEARAKSDAAHVGAQDALEDAAKR